MPVEQSRWSTRGSRRAAARRCADSGGHRRAPPLMDRSIGRTTEGGTMTATSTDSCAAAPTDGEPVLMLPAEAYTSPEVLAWERRHLFAGQLDLPGSGRRPVPAGRERPVTQRAVMVGDVPCLLVRDGDDAADVRQHLPAPRPRAAARGRYVGPAQASCCPYHAWTYDLERPAGGCARVPRGRALRVRRARPGRAARAGLARLGLRARAAPGRLARGAVVRGARRRPGSGCSRRTPSGRSSSPTGTPTRSRRTGR